jgi:hypothetical protein
MSITDKGEVVPAHTTMAYMGGQGAAPLSPYLGSGQLQASATLLPLCIEQEAECTFQSTA